MGGAAVGGCGSRSFDADAKAEGWREGLAGDRDGVCSGRFGICEGGNGRRGDGEAQFAVSALGAKALGQLGFLAGTPGKGQGAKGFGSGKIRRGAELGGRMAQKTPLQCGGERGKTRDIQSQAIGCGAATSADGSAGQEEWKRCWGRK